MRFRLVAAFVVLACCIALWLQPATASVELKLNYWPATTNVTGTYVDPEPPSNWTTQFWGGDFRWTSNQHWGVHLKYDTGSEGSWGGALAGHITGGTDTIWSGDVFYAWQLSAATLRGFVGYGNIQQTWTFGPSPVSEGWQSTGWRVGADAAIPLRNSNFSFNASVAWYPSLNSTFSAHSAGSSLSTSASGGTASDYSASFQYTWPRGWLVEAGYRWVNENIAQTAFVFGPATFTMNGPFFAVGYHW